MDMPVQWIVKSVIPDDLCDTLYGATNVKCIHVDGALNTASWFLLLFMFAMTGLFVYQSKWLGSPILDKSALI